MTDQAGPEPPVKLTPQAHGGSMAPIYTPETCHLGHEARRRKARKAREAKSQPQNPQNPIPPKDIPTCDTDTTLAITRVRTHIKSVDEALTAELTTHRPACAACGCSPGPDPLAIDRLTRALAVLGERLRILLDKPLPGSLRPEAPTKRKGSGSLLGE